MTGGVRPTARYLVVSGDVAKPVTTPGTRCADRPHENLRARQERGSTEGFAR